MKLLLTSLLWCSVCLMTQGQTAHPDSVSVFTFHLDFELTNDQGDLETVEYLKNYATKRKSRALEYMYPVLEEFYTHHLQLNKCLVRPFSHLSDIKSNVYGIPALNLGKAVKSGASDRYLKIDIKDIGQVIPGKINATTGQSIKPVVIRCRIQLYDSDKNMLKGSEAQFETGEKVGSQYNLGVDLRQNKGSSWEQELKFYEICCKMAFLRAVEKL